jgi:ABC-2 type transport system permease protein
VSRAAPFHRAVASQAAVEARLTARRGENLLAMVVLPAVALVAFGTLVPGDRETNALLAATLALAIVASGLVNLGIATAYERGYGVLKRLGGAPLGRSGLLAAKLAIVALIAAAQVVALVVLAGVALGWRPGADASIAAVALTTVVGAAAFAAMGLFLAGALRPEATLVAANGLFFLALLVGGLLVPLDALGPPWQTVAELLPFGAMTGAFDAALGAGGELLRHLVVVAGWGLAASVATIRTFRWTPD